MERSAPRPREQLGWLDPSIFGLGTVGGDSEQRDDGRASRREVEGEVDVRHELLVVGHEVVRWQDHHALVRCDGRDPQERVEDRRRRPPVLGLGGDLARPDVGQQRGVEVGVGGGDREEGAARRNGHSDPPPHLVEQGRLADQPAELLGAVVAGNAARQLAQPRALASRQDDGRARRSGARRSEEGIQHAGSCHHGRRLLSGRWPLDTGRPASDSRPGAGCGEPPGKLTASNGVT